MVRPATSCSVAVRSALSLLMAMHAAGCGAQAHGQVQVQVEPAAAARRAAAGLAAETALLQRILTEVGTASCASAAECRTLAIGSKACGGPAQWMAWSATVSRGDHLQTLSGELAQRQQRREAAAGLVSTCSVVTDPGADCIAGRCMLISRDPTR